MSIIILLMTRFLHFHWQNLHGINFKKTSLITLHIRRLFTLRNFIQTQKFSKRNNYFNISLQTISIYNTYLCLRIKLNSFENHLLSFKI